MVDIPKYKTISGKRYSLEKTFTRKDQANIHAEKLRIHWKNARVVKDSLTKKWCVYSRNKA